MGAYMLNIQYTCRVLPFKEKGKPDAPLRCRVSWESGSRRVSFNLGYRVDPQKWDSRMQACVPGSFHGTRRDPAAAINRAVSAVRAKVEGFFSQCSERGVSPSESELRAAVLPDSKNPGQMTLIAAVDRFVLDQARVREWSENTHKNYARLVHRLREWEPDVLLSAMDASALDRFTLNLKDAGLRHSYIRGLLSALSAVLTWAGRKGYHVPASWKDSDPQVKVVESVPVFLTWEELMALWSMDPDRYNLPPHSREARDIFCFCAFTSLRFSDAVKLRWEDVGAHSISVVTKKTWRPVVVDLNRWSQAVLDEYVDEDFGGYVLPRVGISTVIACMKSLCRALGFNTPVRRVFYQGGRRVEETVPKWKLVGSHTARKTFVCCALSMGIPAQVVMKWTGHSDYKSLVPYIDITDAAKAGAMSKFDDYDPE